MRSYSGIGSRQAPTQILDLMTRIASRLAKRGYVLRSGAADGSDIAFEAGARGVGGDSEIFLPWRGFNGSASPLFNLPLDEQAALIASHVHPAWADLKPPVRKLHARNVYQVLGRDLRSPVDFVVCWTPDGAESWTDTSISTGGTGTAIKIADLFKIPVINLHNEGALDRIAEIVHGTSARVREALRPPKLHRDGSIPTSTTPDVVWVFGSNLAGRHGAGAAKVAAAQFGAQPGQGVGVTGKAYAIPTKDADLKVLPLEEVTTHIEEFVHYAHRNPQLNFVVTRIGCGLAGYSDKVIAPIFTSAPDNCSFAPAWLPYLLKPVSNAPSPTRHMKPR